MPRGSVRAFDLPCSARAASTVTGRSAACIVVIAALAGSLAACNESALMFLDPKNAASVSDVLRRELDCTLTLLRVQRSDQRVIASVPDYGGDLRRQAGLGPGGGIFPGGCSEADATRDRPAGHRDWCAW